MSESQARVPQEGDGQRRWVPDAGESDTKRPAQPEDVDGAEVGEFTVLEVAPDLLDGIELRCIARQAFDRQPRPLVSEIPVHDAALVRTESVPDQDDGAAAEMALEGPQKADERQVVVAPGP